MKKFYNIKKAFIISIVLLIAFQLNSMSIITLKAATEAPNQEELHEEYGLKKGERSRDKKYDRCEESGYYYATPYGYNSSYLLEEVRKYLGIKNFDYFVTLDPYSGYGRTVTTDTAQEMLLRNVGKIRTKLLDNSERKNLADIGAKNTNWINSSWEEAADLTFLHMFGIVNDDFGLIEYDRNKICSRKEFYTMFFRMVNKNVSDGYMEQAFKEDSKALKLWNKIIGNNSKYRNFAAAIVNDMPDYTYPTDRFYYDKVDKKFINAGITCGEVYSFVCGQSKYDLYDKQSKRVPLGPNVEKKLIKTFNDITEKNFIENYEDPSNIKKEKMSYREAINLWIAWKLDMLKPDKNGNMNMKRKMKYKECVQILSYGTAKLYKKYSNYK